MTAAAARPAAARIDALLPQTQCTRCGFDGCRPYAEALAAGTAPINRCPPGGRPVIAALADLLGVPVVPLDPACGVEAAPRVVVIDEPACIGCAKCIDVCPTDAIAGARKWLHTVIAADCSGCDLCLPACPVDCIVPVAAAADAGLLDGAAIASRARHFGALYAARQSRLERDAGRRQAARAATLSRGQPPSGDAAP